MRKVFILCCILPFLFAFNFKQEGGMVVVEVFIPAKFPVKVDVIPDTKTLGLCTFHIEVKSDVESLTHASVIWMAQLEDGTKTDLQETRMEMLLKINGKSGSITWSDSQHVKRVIVVVERIYARDGQWEMEEEADIRLATFNRLLSGELKELKPGRFMARK